MRLVAEDFEIIIATYNREHKAIGLVKQLFEADPRPARVIVVDSSDTPSVTLPEIEGVAYVRSNHKNQPYQRYLGWLNARSEYLVFLDDDIEIIETDFIKKYRDHYKLDPEIVGMMGDLREKHENTKVLNAPRSFFSRFNTDNSKLISVVRRFVGYPILEPGRFWWCGVRGKMPDVYHDIYWLRGGAFSARRDALFKNFNFQLFDIFERRLGMGEDVILGYTLSRLGKLKYIPNFYFIHNDQGNSTYTVNYLSHATKVAYSRLYLSVEYGRLNGFASIRAYLIYYWYMFWRVFGQLINIMIKPSWTRLAILEGTLKGWWYTRNFKFAKGMERNAFWEKEAGITK